METFDKKQYVENLLSSAQQYTHDEVFEIYCKLTPQQKIEALWDALSVAVQDTGMNKMDCMFYAMGFDFDYTNSLGNNVYTKNREGI